MTRSRPYSATLDDLRAVNRAFTDRRHDAEAYRKEAARLRCEAEMRPNASVARELLAVSRKFDELAATVERMQAGGC